MPRLAALLATAAVAAPAAGCGVDDPYNDTEPSRPAAAATEQHQSHAHDRELPRDRRDPAAMTTRDVDAGADAREIAIAYGLAQTNWSWRTFAAQYERMRRLAGAGLAAQLAANRPEHDQLDGIKADRQTNTSKLVAADVIAGDDARHDVVVVYRELAGGRGVTDIAPRHTVYKATVKRLRQGVRVTAWTLLP